ncbi:protein LYRIC-like [Corythoichthys intestinalis]|uniref:protein LYRIC-like n=1 Tax=Corythoichthys intestinalis TaxID=161448 RepID=UPI0025A53E4A|nr:protein LYRIC-like [Corythoichthys intestinalis]XP_061788941.1 protein LYRIC-like [Nerophis lumbriciformis]
MERWRDAASEQAELLAGRVNELLIKGKDFLRTELGVDLALEPELIPPWAILVAVCAGLVLMLVIWASLCQALFKKRPTIEVVERTVDAKRGTEKTVKVEEPKKRKKKAEKKFQPNGRAVTDVQEEDAIVGEEKVPHQQPPPQTKSDKDLETKKSKKKAKQAAKETVGTAVGKEPEEGTWETKVSNKEKREQRKKDKSDGSASPGGGGGGGGGTPVSITPEQRKTSAATPPPTRKKKKVEPSKVTAEKVTAAVTHVNSEAPVVAAGVADSQAVKVPQPVAPKTKGSWTAPREPAPLWKTDIDDSWTVIDRVPADMVSFTKLGVGTADAQLVDNAPWLSQPQVDDEWSGLNGGSADLSSDWNAPAEVWGNYEEPMLQQPPSEPAKPNLLSGAADDDDEKDTGESAADGAAKSKKKRKKKKKAPEEGETGQTEMPEKNVEPPVPLKEEKEASTTTKKKKKQKQQPPPTQEHSAAAVLPLERQVKDSTSQKPLSTQVPPKQPEAHATVLIDIPVPTQQKSEESQAKLSKKKKARRET